MGSTIAAIVTIVALAGWHRRIRRHPNWRTCRDARFYITLGYPAVMIAVYWLTETSTGTDWEWLLGNLWAFGAMVAFVHGFNALHAATVHHQAAARAIESMGGPGDHHVGTSARQTGSQNTPS